ncbi:MAG: anhydro-N-acetylmuramic acid kinase [Draconibacterium sp.]|nr:anhydro-N-acetylmuramic acid kinase [Draconibacterium sp.]
MGEILKAIGVMSGTSLDGLDLAAVEFLLEEGKWNFNLTAAETIPYTSDWEHKLQQAPFLSGEELTELNSNYGRLLGKEIKNFVTEKKISPDLIASHGHTVFHRPDKGYTLQIGNGADIAAITNTLTISDFRIGDVALGGQGAPLVPIGDKLLFSEYDYCLNLGGFANISFEKDKRRVAFDNCPVNFVLNHFAHKLGKPYDKDGDLGRKGIVNKELLEKLNNLSYYQDNNPKSLGREWVEQEFFPILNKTDIPDIVKLRTLYEHIAIQIARTTSGEGKMLVTGGGAFNKFLIERIENYTSTKTVIPTKEIVEFKEAIIFAFIGVLRYKRINNCLSSVTGASKDSCGGIVFLPS